MATMYVAFLLDFFQPSPQSNVVLDEVVGECYLPLVELFNSDLNPKFTVSMANSLANLLVDYGKEEVLDGLKMAINGRGTELVHTGAYHPIFPLMPEREVRRQIELDIKFKLEHFGLLKLSGLFSPEMCYHDRLVPLYQAMGFHWTVIDDQVAETNGISVPAQEIFQVNGFSVLMRSAWWSDKVRRADHEGERLTGRKFVDQMGNEIAGKDHDCYKIIALSGETFGHHVKYYQETFLREMLFALRHRENVRLCLVSDLLNINSLHKCEKQKEIGKGFAYFPPSSWATQADDYRRGDPYPHWCSRGNPIHEKLWQLTGLILSSCEGISFEDNANHDLRKLLDRAFYSTQYFWASIWFWEPERAEQIYEGIDLQMRALYMCAELTQNARLLKEGEDLYTQLMWEIYKA